MDFRNRETIIEKPGDKNRRSYTMIKRKNMAILTETQPVSHASR